MWTLLWAVFAVVCAAQTFTVENDNFVLNGTAVRLLSSSFHYFRAPHVLWRDRLMRLKAMGINSVEAYVPWNWHEQRPGEFDFSSPERDLAGFLALCHSLDLLVLLRPGPYICGEWEYGGFPSWFPDDVVVRTYNGPYIALVTRFWTEVFGIVKPFLFENGGPVVLIQMENEFGFYGDVQKNPLDKQYLEYLVQLTRALLGPRVVLYTTTPIDSMGQGTLTDGSVVSLPDFGPDTNSSAVWAQQKQFNPPGKSPRMCTEYYTGWISTWGAKLANTSSADVASSLETLLSQNASVSFYMGFGGTNWGWWNGADLDKDEWSKGNLQPVLQSYDYNAPVSESGTFNLGADGVNKFLAVQAVLQKYHSRTLPPLPPLAPVGVPPPLASSSYAHLFENLVAFPSFALPTDPVFMERLNQSFGYIVYSHIGEVAKGVLRLPQLNDRVHVFADSKLVTVRYHNDHLLDVLFPGASSSVTLMVENLGRVNFGPALQSQRKGLEGPVHLNVVSKLRKWTAHSVALEPSELAMLSWRNGSCSQLPCFVQFHLNLAQPVDLFISTEGWSKGVVLVNDFNLGRYWQASMPQKTLYVPACLLKSGDNRIVLLETDVLPGASPLLRFSPTAVWRNKDQ
jgi:beta-galactosidase